MLEEVVTLEEKIQEMRDKEVIGKQKFILRQERFI